MQRSRNRRGYPVRAFCTALAAGAFDAVVPVFIWSSDEEGGWAPGGAHRWWLYHSLKALTDDLANSAMGWQWTAGGFRRAPCCSGS